MGPQSCFSCWSVGPYKEATSWITENGKVLSRGWPRRPRKDRTWNTWLPYHSPLGFQETSSLGCEISSETTSVFEPVHPSPPRLPGPVRQFPQAGCAIWGEPAFGWLSRNTHEAPALPSDHRVSGCAPGRAERRCARRARDPRAK